MIPQQQRFWRGVKRPVITTRANIVQSKAPAVVPPVLGRVSKITVVILVYNRLENLRRWMDCWKMCDKTSAEMVVIHNHDTGMDVREYQKLCVDNGVKYVSRRNIGYDIGAFQDVCRERLQGFDNNWQALLWIADDTWAMNRDFTSLFLEGINKPGVGVACMEISDEVTPHVRTTGFCIRKEMSKKLQFPADVITTKQQCYLFEHRGGQRTMYRQLNMMGVKALMISGLAESPLWDSHHRKYLRREWEYHRAFAGGSVVKKQANDKVVFICLAYNTFPEIVSSMINQTHKNWELVLIHDGPCKFNLKGILDVIGDSRINYIETKAHVGNWGHSLRQWALNELKEGRLSDADYVVITNADNHHCPTYTEYLLNGFSDPSMIGAYCSQMVHNYISPQQLIVFDPKIPISQYKELKWEAYKWGIINCSLKRGYVDCGGVMIKRDVACEIGWNNVVHHSADWFFFADIIKRYGTQSFVKVNGCLLIHN